MKRTYRYTAAVFLAVIAVGAVYWKAGIFFETNDDRIISEALSGAITGTPSAYVQVVSCLLSAPLALLYRLAGGIPWYGLCLIFFHVISYSAVFSAVLSRCTKRSQILPGVGLCLFLFAVNLYSVGLIQWTSTAALLAIAGYAGLIINEDGESVAVFAALELFGFLLRDEAMLMIQPLGAAVLFGFFLGRRGWREKSQCRLLLKWALVIAGILAIGTVSRGIVYHSEEWKRADAYYDARVSLMDYYGFPPYEEVRSILDRHQVTVTEYEGFANWIMLGSNIDADCVEELAEYAKDTRSPAWDPAGLLRSLAEKLIEPSLICNRLTGLLWACALLWMVLARRRDMLLPTLGLGAARTAVWCYLLYRGRTPIRVALPLFFAEIVFLLAILFKDHGQETIEPRWRKFAALCLCAAVAYFGCRTGLNQYRYVKAVNDTQALYIQGYREIREYCRQHSADRYVLDTYSFNSYKGSALETGIYRPGNGIYSGVWIGQSPAFREYERNYLGDGGKDFYVITYDDGQPEDVQRENITVRYFTEKTGMSPYLSDSVTVSHGAAYLVWHFEGTEDIL